MKSRSSTEWLKARGFKPKLQTMDNEASAALKSYQMKNDTANYQLVPTHCHRRNTTQQSDQFTPSRNSLWQDKHLWILISQCIYETVYYPKRQ
jgi:hypothetical protein